MSHRFQRWFSPRFRRLVVDVVGLCVVFGSAAPVGWAENEHEEVYLAPEKFYDQAFADGERKPGMLWLTPKIKPDIKSILGHDYAGLRVRYWRDGKRTAWILEEIGKVKPITTGIVIDRGRISRLEVLIYRESHGWEVRYPFFTDQFKGAALTQKLKLDSRIDGIAGATLSVNALKRLGRLALYLDQQVQQSSGS